MKPTTLLGSGVSTSLAALWQGLRHAGALMVGLPDYDTYCQHMQVHHPEQPPLSRAAFAQNRMAARYGGKNIDKCPC